MGGTANKFFLMNSSCQLLFSHHKYQGSYLPILLFKMIETCVAYNKGCYFFFVISIFLYYEEREEVGGPQPKPPRLSCDVA